MEEFLHQLVFLHLDLRGKDFFYVCAYVKAISETHITIVDKTKTKEEQQSISYRKIDIIEIKLSNRKAHE